MHTIKFVPFALLLQASAIFATQSMPLTLPEAERMAVASAPELQRLQATEESLSQQSVAEGQLSDPKLMAGAINVPTNTFSFNQDDMTMIAVGLEQSFPHGHSLAIKSRQTQALANAEKRKAQEQIVMLLQNVRKTWLDLYYWTHAARIIHRNRSLLANLLKVTTSQYSTGKNNLSNLLQTQVELTRLDDQLTQIQQQIDVLRAQLGRWVGQTQANRPLPSSLPRWRNPASLQVMQMRLQQHPLLKVDAANIEAARDEVAFAKEQFKPGFTVDLSYGIRQGNMVGGIPRSDMVTAQVSMDLPIFSKNRQGRRLQASRYQLEATEFDQQIHYRNLLKELREEYAIWQRLGQREQLFTRKLIPETTQNSKAALLSYQSANSDLTTVLRAYTNERNIKLERLQVQIERAKIRAALLYLEGLSK